MEPAIVNPEPAVFRSTEDFSVALPKADLGIFVGLSRMHRLRCDDVVSGHHHHEGDLDGFDVIGGQSVKPTALVDQLKHRPPPAPPRPLSSPHRQLRQTPETLALLATRVLLT